MIVADGQKKKNRPVEAVMLLLLFSTLVASLFVDLATANPVGIEERYDSPPVVSVYSPVNGSNVNSVLLNVTVTKSRDWLSTPISFSYEEGSGLSQKLVSVSYDVDGKFYGSVAPDSNLASPFNYCLYLTNLNDGSHTLIIRAGSTGVVRNYVSSSVFNVPVASVIATVNFTLDTTPPNVTLLSTENPYATSDVPLNFTVNEPVSKVSYVLDKQENATVTGNTTLTGLAYGVHNLTIYATDAYGNTGASETITFIIAEAKPESFPAVPVAVGSVTVAAFVSAGVIVFFKKRKH